MSDDDLIQSAWQDVAGCLDLEKKRLYEELRNYPTPITACDQQFNYLLERQANIAGELRRMQEAGNETAGQGEAVEQIKEFVRSLNCIDADAKERILSRLLESRSQPKA